MRKILSKADDSKKLFADEGQKIHLQVTGIKLPKDERGHVLNMSVWKICFDGTFLHYMLNHSL